MKDISDNLMDVTKLLQDADEETKKQFAICFEAARKLGEKGLTTEQVQVIAIMGQQCAANPELKQMLEYLQTITAFDPKAEFN